METPIINAGGARIALSVDLTNPKDQALVRREITHHPKRWRAITDLVKDQWVKDLEIAGSVARAMADSNDEDTKARGAMILVSGAKTGAMMVGQQQRDEHHAEDLEAGVGQNQTLIINNDLRSVSVANQSQLEKPLQPITGVQVLDVPKVGEDVGTQSKPS